MSLGHLRIWANFGVTMAALNAANSRAYGQTEPERPKNVSPARWDGMIKYFFTRYEELSKEEADHT